MIALLLWKKSNLKKTFLNLEREKNVMASSRWKLWEACKLQLLPTGCDLQARLPQYHSKILASPMLCILGKKACPSKVYLCFAQNTSQPTLFYQYICFNTSDHFINAQVSVRECFLKRLRYFSVQTQQHQNAEWHLRNWMGRETKRKEKGIVT